MQCNSRWSGTWESSSFKNPMKFVALVESVVRAITSPVAHSNAANRARVPWRLYSNACSPGRPSTAGRVGLIFDLAWMPVFSSTENTAQFSPGLR